VVPVRHGISEPRVDMGGRFGRVRIELRVGEEPAKTELRELRFIELALLSEMAADVTAASARVDTLLAQD